MDKGAWVWPTDPRGQRRVLRQVAASVPLMKALQGIAKSKEGLSNPEVDELLGDSANWITLWSVRQLMALGFIEYKVDPFGSPARYAATDLGRSSLGTITGAPPPASPAPAQAPAAPAPPKPTVTPGPASAPAATSPAPKA
jgi:hypothetical protein